MDFKELEDKLGYTFNDKTLLETALTHRSYVNEVRVKKYEHNERLEFLGDAVLQLVSSDYLFNKFKRLSEGELSKLRSSAVCETALFEHSKAFSLGDYIKLGVGAEKEGGRKKPSIVSDCMEAIIAAIYLDAGLKEARKFIEEHILFDVEFDEDIIDAKSRLQELYQKTHHQPVRYEVISEEGPDNDKKYVIQAFIGEKALMTGVGTSKKAAEQNAAFNTLKNIKEVNKN